MLTSVFSCSYQNNKWCAISFVLLNSLCIIDYILQHNWDFVCILNAFSMSSFFLLPPFLCYLHTSSMSGNSMAYSSIINSHMCQTVIIKERLRKINPLVMGPSDCPLSLPCLCISFLQSIPHSTWSLPQALLWVGHSSAQNLDAPYFLEFYIQNFLKIISTLILI